MSGWTVPAVEVREDADGTDSLIADVVRSLDRDDVVLRDKEWRCEAETPYQLVLTQWLEHDHHEATGPKVRVTFTVQVEEVTR